MIIRQYFLGVGDLKKHSQFILWKRAIDPSLTDGIMKAQSGWSYGINSNKLSFKLELVL